MPLAPHSPPATRGGSLSSVESPIEFRARVVVENLRTTFRAGRTKPMGWRKEQLRSLDAFLVRREASILDALTLDLGRAPMESWASEIGQVRGDIREALRNMDQWAAPEPVDVPLVHAPASARVEREPLGVVLVIGPWNYPLQLVLAPLVAALAAGNCVVLKPSEIAAHVASLLEQELPQILDPEAVRVWTGGVEETQAILAQRLDHIFYTGNGVVGRIVMAAAARHLTPVTLELGGKSPAIVDHTADLAVTARRLAWGRFMNAGQTCVAPDHVYVEDSVGAALVEHLRLALRGFYGKDPRQSKDYARIVNARHLARLTALLKGAEVLEGGIVDVDARYLSPTIVWNPPEDSPLMEEEIFGPILPVLPVRSVDEAIQRVGERSEPLVVYAFSKEARVLRRIRENTRSGAFVENDTIIQLAIPELPFGGLGESGMGAYHGRAGFETFSHRRSILSRGLRFDLPMRYPPYSEGSMRLLKKVF